MNKLLMTLFLAFFLSGAMAQTPADTLADTHEKPFRGYFLNDEYEVFLRLNLYDEDVEVPGQELYGFLPGYLGTKRNSFAWLVTSAKVKGDKAELSLINDYGSEDLTASLSIEGDSVITLKQEKGSTLKVPKNSKWQKLPTVLIFRRK